MVGFDNKIYKFDLDFQLVASVDLEDESWCGISVNQNIVCGMKNSESLRVFDTSLNLIKEVELEENP